MLVWATAWFEQRKRSVTAGWNAYIAAWEEGRTTSVSVVGALYPVVTLPLNYSPLFRLKVYQPSVAVAVLRHIICAFRLMLCFRSSHRELHSSFACAVLPLVHSQRGRLANSVCLATFAMGRYML